MIDWIADKFVAGKIGGLNTKLGAAAGALIAAAAILNLLAQAFVKASEGHYMEAIRILSGQEMGVALGGLAAIKMALGIRKAQEDQKVATVAAVALSQQDATLNPTTAPLTVHELTAAVNREVVKAEVNMTPATKENL